MSVGQEAAVPQADRLPHVRAEATGPPMSATTTLLGGVLDAATAAVIGLPRFGARGLEWHFGRAGLPYSLASELSHTADRTTLACYTKQLIDSLDPRKKGWPKRPVIPPRAHFERGLTSAKRNPADKVALAHVAKFIVRSKGPVRQPDATGLYVRVRQQVLNLVKEHHYPQLPVPAYDAPARLVLVRRIITSELPLMSFPYQFSESASGAPPAWCYALLPDLPSVETSEAAQQLGLWYKVLAAEKQPRAGGLQAQQLRDLEAIVSNGMKPVLRYLVVTLTNPATRRTLNISDGEARSVRLRFDALYAGLRLKPTRPGTTSAAHTSASPRARTGRCARRRRCGSRLRRTW